MVKHELPCVDAHTDKSFFSPATERMLPNLAASHSYFIHFQVQR
jgi:hypothetical protein